MVALVAGSSESQSVLETSRWRTIARPEGGVVLGGEHAHVFRADVIIQKVAHLFIGHDCKRRMKSSGMESGGISAGTLMNGMVFLQLCDSPKLENDKRCVRENDSRTDEAVWLLLQ